MDGRVAGLVRLVLDSLDDFDASEIKWDYYQPHYVTF
jgi:hypothetical protein